MTLAERLILKGKLEGQREGKLEGKLETAREMLHAGADIAFIAKVTHLSLDKIKALKSKH